MKTQYFTAASINGYIADENNSLEWLFQFGDDDIENHYIHFINNIGAIAMGSTTYQWLIDHEKMTEHPEKWPYKIPVWVFSRQDLPVIGDADIRIVKGDVGPFHGEMAIAAKGKNIWLAGGGDLVGQFYDQGLLDEIIITVAPVTLGSGAPLLPRNISFPPLKLINVEKYSDVFAVLTYNVQK